MLADITLAVDSISRSCHQLIWMRKKKCRRYDLPKTKIPTKTVEKKMEMIRSSGRLKKFLKNLRIFVQLVWVLESRIWPDRNTPHTLATRESAASSSECDRCIISTLSSPGLSVGSLCSSIPRASELRLESPGVKTRLDDGKTGMVWLSNAPLCASLFLILLNKARLEKPNALIRIQSLGPASAKAMARRLLMIEAWCSVTSHWRPNQDVNHPFNQESLY